MPQCGRGSNGARALSMLLSARRTASQSGSQVKWMATDEEILGRCREIAAVFAAVDESPLAAASIAQVHFAVLRDGRRMKSAVKFIMPPAGWCLLRP